MSVAHTTVAYDGPDLQSGTMDVRDLAPALMAIGQLCERANLVLNGNKSSVKVNVKTGFRPGSFMVDLSSVQTFFEQARTLLNADTTNAALNLLEIIGLAGASGVSLFKLFKRLRGKPAESATTLTDWERAAYVY